MQSRMTTDLALQALLAAVWRRKPKQKVLIHSDQGSQFTSTEWQSFLSKHNLDASMSQPWELSRQRSRRKLLPPAETRAD